MITARFSVCMRLVSLLCSGVVLDVGCSSRRRLTVNIHKRHLQISERFS